MKATVKDHVITCNKGRKKVWEVAEAKDKPGYAICPSCGCYHRIKKGD